MVVVLIFSCSGLFGGRVRLLIGWLLRSSLICSSLDGVGECVKVCVWFVWCLLVSCVCNCCCFLVVVSSWLSLLVVLLDS